MKQTVNRNMFVSDFLAIRPDNFTYEGLCALFDYLEELGEDLGEDLELDVIAICCDFSQYEDLKEFQDNYGDEYASVEDIEDHTTVIDVPGEGFIVRDF